MASVGLTIACVYVCVLVLALASLVIVCVVCHVFASMVSRLGLGLGWLD